MIEHVLPCGRITVVDDEDKHLLSEHHWYAHRDTSGKIYVRANHKKTTNGIKKQWTVYLHSLVAEAPKGVPVDHKDHNTFNNRRKNLRVCDHSINGLNRSGPTKENRLGVLGVSYQADRDRYLVRLAVKGKTHLRYTKTLEAAVAARKELEISYEQGTLQ
jgi:hypothetical protein